jgi:hypothetical protein
MKAVPKQDYRPPRFLVYGDLCQITKAQQKGAKNDHSGGNAKTA